jgi:AcrR family transcriptional regulator
MTTQTKPTKTRNKPKDTRERLLDSAEELFAEKGIRMTSLREITHHARANLAAVNYHFHSKAALVQAVFERSFGPLNRERVRLLDEAEAAAGDQPPAIEAILHALFEPMVRTWRENRNFILLAGRLQYESDASLRQYILDLYEEVTRRFFAAATRAVPEVPDEDVFWWVHFLFTGMVHSLLSSEALQQFSRGVCRGDDDRVLDRMIVFGAAGFRGVPDAREQSSAAPTETDVYKRPRQDGVPGSQLRKESL